MASQRLGALGTTTPLAWVPFTGWGHANLVFSNDLNTGLQPVKSSLFYPSLLTMAYAHPELCAHLEHQ